VQPLREILDAATSPLLVTYRSCLDDPRLASMQQKIEDVIHPNTHFSRKTLDMRTQKCFAVKSGLNGKRF
jgi:DNA mismatch repair protein MSH4